MALLVLAACSGDDGAPGPPGPQGPVGPPPAPLTININNAGTVIATISEASIDGTPSIVFSLEDENGTPVTGLPASAFGVSLAKLRRGSDGNPSQWQSYLNRVEAANGIGPGTVDQVHAVTENGSAGTLLDNDDGSYQYTFATDVVAGVSVPYQPELTHRVGFEIRGFGNIDNPTYDWQPSTGATENLFTREIVSDMACNRCHDKLALHGGARFQNRYCVNCHNPGSADAQSGNTMDMTVMTHKIHRGSDLPSVQAGGQYAIWGFSDRLHDYSSVVYPQDIRNCRNCHDEGNTETPDAANWFMAPTAEACGACHDNVDFESGQNHGNGISASNSECTICHAPGSELGADEAHTLLAQEAAKAFQLNILDVLNASPGTVPTVRVSVTDPTNNDAPYDLLGDPAFSNGGRLAALLAWSNLDISNRGSGSGNAGSPAQPISINVLSQATDNGDGSFTATASAAIPASASGSGTVAMESRPRIDVDGDGNRDNIPVQGTARSFAITDGVPVDRRQIVDLARCNDCHQSLSLHGGNRTDNIELCVTCHNPNATDIAARTRGGANAGNSPDNKDEETIEFKTMIHAIHAGAERENGYYAYGFFGEPVDYSEVVYPGNLASCDGCHTPNTYYPVGAFALAVTTDTGANLEDPDDDINITPNTAACWGCHDRPAAVAHMENNGGAFDVMQTPTGTLISVARGTVIETCDVCHGPGRSADVKVLHDLQ